MRITQTPHTSAQNDIPLSKDMAQAYIHILLYICTLACKQGLLRTRHVLKAAHGLVSSLPTSWPLPGMFPGLLQLSYSGLGIA